MSPRALRPRALRRGLSARGRQDVMLRADFRPRVIMHLGVHIHAQKPEKRHFRSIASRTRFITAARNPLRRTKRSPLLPPSPGSGPRPDVVRRRGRYALINENRTPYQAMVEDLLFVRSVLAAAGLDYLLVRGNNDRPVIAVDWKNRKELRDALVEACRNEPFYSMSVTRKKKSSVLVADGELYRNRQSRIFRLYRPRVELDRRLRVRGLRRRPARTVELRRGRS